VKTVHGGLMSSHKGMNMPGTDVSAPSLTDKDREDITFAVSEGLDYLAHSFVRRFASEQRRGAMTLLPDALDAIEAHNWPGNVRELENVIKRAVIMADGSKIGAVDIGLASPEGDAATLNLRQVRDEAEKGAVVRVLARVNGNLSKAAELLGVSRPTLYDLMDRFGLR